MIDRPLIAVLAASQQYEELIATKLEDEFHLVQVSSAEALIAFANESKPIDVILLYNETIVDDCLLIKKYGAFETVPVVAMARFGNEHLQEQLIQSGATDYLDMGNLAKAVVEARVRSLYELKRNQVQLEELAGIDPLTGVRNRFYFDDAIDTEWRRCCREFNALSMIMIDVDAFTTFNEHYGIGVGDNCLKRIAGVIENNCLRAGDVVSRFMADQFVAILPGTEFENAMRVAENICRAVASLNLINEYSDCADTVTVSVGIGAVNPTQDQDHKVFIQEVEEILHRAQQKGGNQALGVEL